MKPPHNAPLTDAEAEAVLRALGPQLEWEHPMGRAEEWHRADPPNGAVYTAESIIAPDGEHYMTTFWQDGKSEFGAEVRMFKTIDAAKAACERHYATGKWE